jgi:glycosyltransferase involved in cell wall biosynthesis
LCESEAGKRELLNYYPLFERKTKVLPIFASKIIQFEARVDGRLILDKFGISTNKFFFYPAQFWPGKNHYGLIKAFELLLAGNESSELKLVLSGSDKGNLEYILGLIRHLNLQEHVIVTGFITDEELVTMYKNAIALVMPTYLGPTNMPLLEAAHLKCPIVCSDLEGHREMLQEHALYCDPSKPEQLLDAMRKVLNNELRNQLADSCYRHIRNSFFTVEKSVEKLNAILTEIIPIRKTWGTDFYE